MLLRATGSAFGLKESRLAKHSNLLWNSRGYDVFAMAKLSYNTYSLGVGDM